MAVEDRIYETKVESDKVPALEGFIYVPSIKLYVQKETQFSENWPNAHQRLNEQGLKMPTLEQFRKFLAYLKQNPSKENTAVYTKIIPEKKANRTEWIDACCEKRDDGWYVLTENRTKAEKVPDYLILRPGNIDRNRDVSLEDWFNDSTLQAFQGFPKSSSGIAEIAFHAPLPNMSGRFSKWFSKLIFDWTTVTSTYRMTSFDDFGTAADVRGVKSLD